MIFRTNPVAQSPPKRSSFLNAISILKNQRSRIIRLGPVAVLALLMVGCGGHGAANGGTGPSPPTPQSTDATTPQSASAPPVEGTGPEKPAPSAAGAPAIDLASLPVGGSADDNSVVHQCVGVRWLGPEIPHGVSIQVTGVRIQPPSVFAVASSGCSGPSCRASYVFVSKQSSCTVPVVAKGPPNETAELHVDGRIDCPAGQQTLCKDFAAQSESQSRPIGLITPDAPQTPVSPSPSS
jgi:hypothetical protein